MAGSRAPRDNRLLDQLDRKERVSFDDSAWRAVRDGRDPLLGRSSGGRWDDGTFDVLYSALDPKGSIAEIFFHLSKGQPVFPTKVKYRLYEIRAALTACLQFFVVDDLSELGVKADDYGRLSYAELAKEYTRTQDIGEAAHFLGCDGLLVPSARFDCQNLVVFTNRVAPSKLEVRKDCGIIDFTAS